MSTKCVFFSAVVLYSLVAASGGKNKGDVEVLKIEKGDIAFPDDLNIGQFPKQNLMYHHHHEFHHHHHPDFHHYHGPEDEESEEKGPVEPELKESGRQIPLNYIQNLNDYNVSDLLLNFVEGGTVEDKVIENRFGGDDAEERSAATIPKGADCVPEPKTIKIASSEDPSILYIPQCTRVEQCGGCCKHDLLSCQPLKKESIPFKVYKTQYTGDKKLKFLGTEVIMVEKHNRCKCQCRVKPEDCSKFQEYRENECGCVCVNFDEKKKCLKHNDTKLWDPKLCSCQCRDVMQCSTGSYFDQNECKCTVSPLTRRMALQRRSFKSEIVPVVPLDEY